MKTIIQKFAVDKRIRAGYGAAFLLVLISYLLTLYANKELIKQARLVDHTNKVIFHLETMLSAIKDAETGSRGYIITQDNHFLLPYNKSKIIADSLFNLVRQETQGNDWEQKKLDTLNDLTGKKFAFLALAIDQDTKRQAKTGDGPISKTYADIDVMDDIRGIVGQLEAGEQQLLNYRSDDMHALHRALNIIIVVSLVLAFCSVTYGFITYSRENNARRKADRTIFEYQEQLKKQIEELNSANKELIQMRSIEKLAATGRIARTIAHEVRNPLTNINLSVEQLKGDFDLTNKNTLQLFDIITRNSNRINQLIADLLSSTKSAELSSQKISVNRLLDETLLLAKDRIQLKNIRIEKNYADDICDISVDIEKMKIALLNIIVNAIEAMQPDHGILKIKTETKNEKCMITISDNGSGIDKASIARLFEPYFTTKPTGTGLGLTNTHNIIVSHNGSIHAESEPGNGTVFIITLSFASI